MKKVIPQVILPTSMKNLPNKRELSAAAIIAEYLKTKVYIVPTDNHKTADFRINSIMWELKTPTGSGKYNIQHALHAAIQQSNHIIIDARFSKLHINKIKRELAYHGRVTTKGIKRLILIQKDNKIIEII